MKVFLTGGSGFVGRFLAGVLTQRGHAVTVLSRGPKEGRVFPAGGAERTDAQRLSLSVRLPEHSGCGKMMADRRP